MIGNESGDLRGCHSLIIEHQKVSKMETIILSDGRTTKGVVEEQGFNGLYWCGYYTDVNNTKHFVEYHGNCWME